MSNTKKVVRTRFCPSPTGFLHIGGVRSALFSYLYAKQNDGVFLVRIEDTDQARLVEGSIDQIIESMEWLGLIPDEGVRASNKQIGEFGPYIQSERLDTYHRYINQLLANGKAYYSYITSEEFTRLRDEAIAAKRPFVYRQAMEPEPPADANTANYPVRLKVNSGSLKWQDEVHGDFKVNHDIIDDFVIMKSDRFPTYNFANVIDDHLMEISHVVRGPEFLPSTPKFVLLYDYLGWKPPKFVHVPVVLGPDGKKKLSKRDGDVDVLEFRNKGYLPEVIVNFLALLGWNDGTTQEIFTRHELIEKFSLARIQKSAAKFDLERLNWMNGEYIRDVLTEEEYLARARKALKGAVYETTREQAYIDKVLLLDRERVKMFSEIPGLVEFFFVAPEIDHDFASLLTKKASREEVVSWLNLASAGLQVCKEDHTEIEAVLRGVVDTHSLNVGQVFYAIRVALTGRTAAPGLFETIATLGVNESIQRIQAASANLT